MERDRLVAVDHPHVVPPQRRITQERREHLGVLDEGLVLIRKMWREELQALRNGEPLKTWETYCALAPDGDSGVVLFAVRGGWLSSAPVGRHRVTWRWQYRTHADAPWTDFAQSDHEIYTTLLPPSAPWSVAPFVDANAALPWSEVLAIACQWAAGANTTEEAASLICLRLFALGGFRFEYGCAVFGREMYTNSLLAVFDCTALVERLQGGEGNGRYVNCTDCACIVSTLANALGARLWQGAWARTYPPS